MPNASDLTQEDIAKIRARCDHLEFMKHCWQRRKPFKVGPHTTAICDEIDIAFKNYRKGISTFLIILVCFRQGKSEIVSRFLPAHFLGEFPDDEVMLTSHNGTLAHKFSRFARGVVRSQKYKELYPEVDISKEKPGLEEWGIEGTQGAAQFMGILSGTAGKGGALCVVDDYCGNREDAESETMRNKTWESFTDNVWTRRADPCIFMIPVTPWHVDDIVGRIQNKMSEDPEFPRFKILRFPAQSPEYESGYLFPGMYSEQWYNDMRKVLGTYGAASLMDCNPQVKAGNMIRTDKIKFYEDDDDLPEGLQFVRAWDLASSKKEKVKSDPDHTAGVKIGIKWIKSHVPGHDIPLIYIDDVIDVQKESTERNKTIVGTAISDGFIRVGIEAFGAYKDAYTTISGVLRGIRSVEKMQLPGDKVAKADPLTPAFEAGNVYMRRAPWNDAFITQIAAFPGGAHDDMVDGMAVGYHMCCTSGISIYTDEDYNEWEETRQKAIDTAKARMQSKEMITCTLDDYTAFLREWLEEKLKEQTVEQKKNYIINEMRRLDRVLGYDDLKGVV